MQKFRMMLYVFVCWSCFVADLYQDIQLHINLSDKGLLGNVFNNKTKKNLAFQRERELIKPDGVCVCVCVRERE